jgi:hypothetical protein
MDLIYSRRPNSEPLTVAQLHNLAPAAFATYPADGVTNKYQHVTTIEAMERFKSSGWLPVQAAQSAPNSRTQSFKRQHQRHLIAFARDKDLNNPEGRPEIVLYNSSDRSSSLKVYNGFFRWICSNSLVAGEGSQNKLMHVKSNKQCIDDLLTSVITNTTQLSDRVSNIRGKTITYDHARDLIKQSLSLRWQSLDNAMMKREINNNEELTGTFWNDRTLIDTFRPIRRGENDLGSRSDKSLWEVFNRAQEIILRGGVDVFSLTDRNQNGAWRLTRAIGDPKKALDYNTKLWDLFEGAV